MEVCSDFSPPSAFQHGPSDSSNQELANGVPDIEVRDVSPIEVWGKVCPATRDGSRHIAKRSCELNAKWMPALGMAAGALWLSVCLVTNAAEPGALSHNDVDKLLVDARAAIAAGNLDRASALVERAEAAQPKYTLFHLGPTPTLVRRELTQAQKAAGKNPTAMSSGSLAAARERQYEPAPMGQPVDPFAERMRPLPSAGAGEPFPPTAHLDMSPPVVPALHSHPVGMPDRGVEQAASIGYGQFSTQPVALPAVAGNPAPIDSKTRALRLLQDARQSLAAGDIDQAESRSDWRRPSEFPSQHFCRPKTGRRFWPGTSNERVPADRLLPPPLKSPTIVTPLKLASKRSRLPAKTLKHRCRRCRPTCGLLNCQSHSTCPPRRRDRRCAAIRTRHGSASTASNRFAGTNSISSSASSLRRR